MFQYYMGPDQFRDRSARPKRTPCQHVKINAENTLIYNIALENYGIFLKRVSILHKISYSLSLNGESPLKKNPARKSRN